MVRIKAVMISAECIDSFNKELEKYTSRGFQLQGQPFQFCEVLCQLLFIPRL